MESSESSALGAGDFPQFSGVLQERWAAFLDIRSWTRKYLRDALSPLGTVSIKKTSGKSQIPDLTLEWSIKTKGEIPKKRRSEFVALKSELIHRQLLSSQPHNLAAIHSKEIPPSSTIFEVTSINLDQLPFSLPHNDQLAPVEHKQSAPLECIIDKRTASDVPAIEIGWLKLVSSFESIITSAICAAIKQCGAQLSLLSSSINRLSRLISEGFAVVSEEEAIKILRARRNSIVSSTKLTTDFKLNTNLTELGFGDLKEVVSHFGNTPTLLVYDRLEGERASKLSSRIITGVLLLPKIGPVGTIGVLMNDASNIVGGLSLSFDHFLGILLQSKLF